MNRKLAHLRRLVRLSEARADLPERTLLHAGPPYKGAPPRAVLAATVQAAVIGGFAQDASAARAMLEAGSLSLEPAQDHGVAVPLAMVVAPSMWCFEVGDNNDVFYSPVSEGPPPALRFGSADPLCVARAHEWIAEAAQTINSQLATLPDVESMMRHALRGGDDCHAVTRAGNDRFLELLDRTPAELAADIRANPGFVLGIWMAWAAWKLHTSASEIVAIGGNGIEFGLRWRGETHWAAVPCAPPTGIRFNPQQTAPALGAIGDSALVDVCGFGGQALGSAPTLTAEWADLLPADAQSRGSAIIHRDRGVIDPDAVRATGVMPIINLAILDERGAAGPIGRGFYIVPPTLFGTGD